MGFKIQLEMLSARIIPRRVFRRKERKGKHLAISARILFKVIIGTTHISRHEIYSNYPLVQYSLSETTNTRALTCL